MEEAVSYSRTFSELIDTGLNGLYLGMNGLYLKVQRRQGVRGSTAKGPVVTGADRRKHRKEFLSLAALYPDLDRRNARPPALVHPGIQTACLRQSRAGSCIAGRQ